jgi:hypothetical protein
MHIYGTLVTKNCTHNSELEDFWRNVVTGLIGSKTYNGNLRQPNAPEIKRLNSVVPKEKLQPEAKHKPVYGLSK